VFDALSKPNLRFSQLQEHIPKASLSFCPGYYGHEALLWQSLSLEHYVGEAQKSCGGTSLYLPLARDYLNICYLVEHYEPLRQLEHISGRCT
jgi:hypothetical protein